MKCLIITGVSKGLGLELASQALLAKDFVIGISRSKPEMQSERFCYLPFDLSENLETETPFAKIQTELTKQKFAEIHLINNAAGILPVGPVDTLDSKQIMQNLQLNLVAPMQLTSRFLQFTQNFSGWRSIVNIGSGAADFPLASWSCYSAAKAALKNFTQCLQLENLQNKKLKIIYYNPSIMDTEMQATIRQVPKEQFSQVDQFKAYKKDQRLNAPHLVAKALLELLAKPQALTQTEYKFSL